MTFIETDNVHAVANKNSASNCEPDYYPLYEEGLLILEQFDLLMSDNYTQKEREQMLEDQPEDPVNTNPDNEKHHEEEEEKNTMKTVNIVDDKLKSPDELVKRTMTSKGLITASALLEQAKILKNVFIR